MATDCKTEILIQSQTAQRLRQQRRTLGRACLHTAALKRSRVGLLESYVIQGKTRYCNMIPGCSHLLIEDVDSQMWRARVHLYTAGLERSRVGLL